MKSKVSERGQVTIPKPLRDRLGIRAGQVLEMHEENGRIVASKVTDVDPLQRVTGVLELDRSTDAQIEELRGEPDAT